MSGCEPTVCGILSCWCGGGAEAQPVRDRAEQRGARRVGVFGALVYVAVLAGGARSDGAVVHTRVHASWLNRAEIYFSVVQRKALTPNDFEDLDTLEEHLLAFGRRYQQIAAPFQWKFTRQDLHKLLAKTHTTQHAAHAA